jgi:hypothetical protein
MDTQKIELIGRHYLAAELLKAGLEVAMPERDRGVDMIAYLDIDENLEEFSACPIQLKASSAASFVLDRKYEKILNLLIVNVWHLNDGKNQVCYALTYSEALEVAERMGWTQTDSWLKGGKYVTTRPSVKLISLLEPFRMTAPRWRTKVLRTMEFAEREAQKVTGRELYQTGKTVAERASGVFMQIEAYFFRNEAAPSLSEYACHWLWANPVDDPAVMKFLVACCPAPAKPRVRAGYSDWDSFGNPSYR